GRAVRATRHQHLTREPPTVHPLLLTALTFFAGALVIAAGYSILSDLVLRDRSRLGKRVDEALRKRQREKARQSSLFKDLGGGLPPELGAADDTQPGLRQRFEAMVEQSGLDLSPRQVLVYMAAAGLVGVGLAVVLRAGVLAWLAAGLAAASGPYLFVWFKRRARLHKLTAQLPDAFDLMGRVIRTGQTIAQALQAVADEF